MRTSLTLINIRQSTFITAAVFPKQKKKKKKIEFLLEKMFYFYCFTY